MHIHKAIWALKIKVVLKIQMSLRKLSGKVSAAAAATAAAGPGCVGDSDGGVPHMCCLCVYVCDFFLSIIKRRVPQHLKMEQEKLQVCLLPDISHENNFLWQCDGFFNSWMEIFNYRFLNDTKCIWNVLQFFFCNSTPTVMFFFFQIINIKRANTARNRGIRCFPGLWSNNAVLYRTIT